MQERGERPTEGVILSGVPEKGNRTVSGWLSGESR